MLAHAQLALGAVLTALVASGCTPSSPPETKQIRFEIRDLSKPVRRAPVVVQSGAVFDVPVVFSIEVRVVETAPFGTSQLRVNTTSYTPQCDGVPVGESYRTKQIVFPPAVTAEPNSGGMVQRWPFSTFILTAAAQCPDPKEPWYPSPEPQKGSFHIQAQMEQPNRTPSAADLTIRVGQRARPL